MQHGSRSARARAPGARLCAQVCQVRPATARMPAGQSCCLACTRSRSPLASSPLATKPCTHNFGHIRRTVQAVYVLHLASVLLPAPLTACGAALLRVCRLACVLQYATFVTPNAAELIAMADAVRQRAGQPLLPRPNLDMVHGAAATHDSGTGSSSSVPAPIVSGPGASSSGRAHAGVVSSGGADASLLVALLQQLAAFAAVLLGAGAQHVVLTLGSLGAALISRHLLAAGEGASRASSSSSPGSSSSACSTACWDQGGRERGAGSSSREGTAASVEVVHMRALPAEVVSVSGAGENLAAAQCAMLHARPCLPLLQRLAPPPSSCRSTHVPRT